MLLLHIRGKSKRPMLGRLWLHSVDSQAALPILTGGITVFYGKRTGFQMAQQNNPQDVIVQAVDVISSLQSFSERIMQARSQLQQHYSQTKEEIYSAISRQLEALRDREVWLLSKVDALREVKEEQLEAELSTVTQGLGILEEKLTLLQRYPDQPLLMTDLKETLNRLKHLDQAPMEDPTISIQFHGDNLRRKIHSFGSVSSIKRPRLDRSHDSTVHSTSALQDEFQALELKDQKELFAIFSEAQPTSYWLQDMKKIEVSWHSSSFSCSPFSTNMSLPDWLVKGNIGEGNDKTDSSMDVTEAPLNDETEEKTAAVSCDKLLEQMDSILQSPHELWLRESESGSNTMSEVEDQRPLNRFCEDYQEWLLVPSPKKEQEELSGCACVKSGDRPLDMDIENLASLICMQNHQSLTTTTTAAESDMSSWLVQSSQQSEEMLPPIEKVCGANEICGSFSECVCDENCAGSMMQRSEEKNGSWLLVSGESNSKCSFDVFEEELVVSDWLVGDENVSQSESGKEANLKWLCDQISPEKQEEDIKCLDEDTSMPLWNEDGGLKKGLSEESWSCPLDALYKYHSTFTTSDWLKKSQDDSEDDGMWLLKKGDEMEQGEDSNKWLVEETKDDSCQKEKDRVKVDPSAFTTVWSESSEWLVAERPVC